MQRRITKRTLTASAAAFAGMAALISYNSASAQTGQTRYQATLTQLNNSGARGSADMILSADGKSLLVHIRAQGLEPGNVHISHIHGRSSAHGQPIDSTCPTLAQDTDRDGFVELLEGQATYGPILIDFMNIDPNKDGVVDFTTTVQDPGSKGALPLTDRHIVVHGLTVGAVGAGTPGEVNGHPGYKTVLPVLCGEIVPASTHH